MPLAGGLKQAHSTAYAIQACALTARATGETDALVFAQETFDWFDVRAHDQEFGGYHGWLTRSGQPVLGSTELGDSDLDPLGHAPGLKDLNVHGDWMEALPEYAEISGDRRANWRANELVEIFLTRISNPDGEIHYALHRDWWPQPEADAGRRVRKVAKRPACGCLTRRLGELPLSATGPALAQLRKGGERTYVRSRLGHTGW